VKSNARAQNYAPPSACFSQANKSILRIKPEETFASTRRDSLRRHSGRGRFSRRRLAPVARAFSEWHQQREGSAGALEPRREHCLEAAPSGVERGYADYLGRPDLPERGR